MRKQMLEELGLLPRWERRSLSSSVQHVAEPEVSEQPILPSQAATASAIVPQPPLNEAVIAKMSWQNLQEIFHAFGKVTDSLTYFVDNWTTVTELMSIVKRLREFERNIGYTGKPPENAEPVQTIR